jgi:hydrogenase/urease accessory protein HupE
MTRAHQRCIRIATLVAGLLPALASAHHGAGEASSFAAGALHPLSGLGHVAALAIVGVLAARLGGRYLAPIGATFLGLLVAAWTTDSDGWHYAAGFMMSGAGLVAAGVAATRLARITAGALRPSSSR